MILYTKNKRQITVDDTPFATGGQGRIHKLISPVQSPEQVVKIFIDKTKAQEAERRIEFMVKNNPFVNAQQMVQNAFSWPLACLYDTLGSFVGFSMRLIQNSESLWSLTIPKGFVKPQWSKFNINKPNSYNSRLKIVYNMAQALDVLDKNGHYRVVDLKPNNMMIDNNGHVTIIDTDSFQISDKGKVLFYAEAATEEYCPPEFFKGRVNFNKNNVDASWDYFAFAVSCYQLLLCIHPFAASHISEHYTQSEMIEHNLFVHGNNRNQLSIIPPPHNNFNQVFNNSLKGLFLKCFDEGYANPNKRPSFSDWRDVFLAEIQRVNNQPITAGINQPPPRKIPIKTTKGGTNRVPQVQPVVATPPPAQITALSIMPGNTAAVLSWRVLTASSVLINGQNVSLSGQMQIPATDSFYRIEALGLNGQRISQTISLIIPVVRDFSYQILSGSLLLKWDVQSASSVSVNGNVLSQSGTLKLPFAFGVYTLEAISPTGYPLKRELRIKPVPLQDATPLNRNIAVLQSADKNNARIEQLQSVAPRTNSLAKLQSISQLTANVEALQSADVLNINIEQIQRINQLNVNIEKLQAVDKLHTAISSIKSKGSAKN